MPVTGKIAPLSAEEYLEGEKTADIKHEFLDGEIYDMVGVKDSHATVALNIAALLKNHLRDGPCRVYISDMKAHLEQANAFFYPDVMVTCDPRDRETDYYKRYPSLIVEVLSDSTGAYDRGGKFAIYRQLDSLREYVLIDPDTASVDCFRKDAQGHWVLYPYGAGETVELASVELRVVIEAVYEGVFWGSEA